MSVAQNNGWGGVLNYSGFAKPAGSGKLIKSTVIWPITPFS